MAGSCRQRAREWMAHDPDPETREEVRALLAAGEDTALADRFGSALEFGTAGLRGALGAGPNRMNRVTVMRAAAGVARWLGAGKLVVIGYDARHRSARFARDSAAVLAGAGCRVLLLPESLPTPVLAHTVRVWSADAGIMVTASHNPPQDNGYKVYAGGSGSEAGAQIVPPADSEIAAGMREAPPVDELPRSEEWRVLGADAVADYVAAVADLPVGEDREVNVTYTPLHGVGAATLAAVFRRAGFPPPRVVPEQAEPDPDFPTTAFPNPEEPGALDLALAAGERDGSDLVLANDPDADRLAVAVPGYGLLTGDDVGGLLGEYVLRQTSGSDRVVASTIVSAGMLATIAEAHGARWVETLTGFKWLARAGGSDEHNVFSYEEALGYCVGGDAGRPVADKDGISAALLVAALAARAKRAGRTLLDLVREQECRYGLHRTGQVSLRVADTTRLAAAMRGLRSDPPTVLGSWEVARVEDFVRGVGGLPSTDALRFGLDGPASARVTLRPSGTEPKLKAYVEVVLPPGESGEEGRSRAAGYVSELAGAVEELFPGM